MNPEIVVEKRTVYAFNKRKHFCYDATWYGPKGAREEYTASTKSEAKAGLLRMLAWQAHVPPIYLGLCRLQPFGSPGGWCLSFPSGGSYLFQAADIVAARANVLDAYAHHDAIWGD